MTKLGYFVCKRGFLFRCSLVYNIYTINYQTQVILSIQYTYPQLVDNDGIHTGMGTISIIELTLNSKHLTKKILF